jgi:hypothetical protein
MLKVTEEKRFFGRRQFRDRLHLQGTDTKYLYHSEIKVSHIIIRIILFPRYIEKREVNSRREKPRSHKHHQDETPNYIQKSEHTS